MWSPDSKWVAYSKSLASHLRAIFLYSFADRKAHQITDGLSDAISPAFDASGKYLYFLASTNYALRTGWLEMSSVDRPVARAIYLAVLSAAEPSPFLPETGDETVAPPARRQGRRRRQPSQRRIRRRRSGRGPCRSRGHRPAHSGARRARRGITARSAGAAGTLFYAETPRAGGAPALTFIAINCVSERRRRSSRAFARIRSLPTGRDCSIAPTATDGASSPPSGRRRSARAPSTSPARGAGRSAREWAQIFRETWRLQREYFYEPRCTAPTGRRSTKSTVRCCRSWRTAPTLGYLIATLGRRAGGGPFLSPGRRRPAGR